MINPIATYRIQFHKDFTFLDLEKRIPYLKKLGVSTIYASPIFEATPGSVHGYDGVNPHRINPEIGTEEQLREISQKLKAHGMKWLQDIVPNHMAFHSNNEWLMDVLEKGPQSLYASFFDVSWNSKIYHGRVMVPFLGSSLEDVISNGELQVAYHNQRLVFKYYDSTYPLQPKSYERILQAAEGQSPQAMRQLIDQIPKMEDEAAYFVSWDEIRMQLAGLIKNDAIKSYIEKCLEAVNNNKEQLLNISEEQSYRLCHWQETDSRINYRRFFTVNGLICVNIHIKEVFDHYHKYIKELLDEGIFQGLRIDHIDGLYDPTSYLQQLRKLVGEEIYIVVEKILEPGEGLPEQWPIQGNTGYDFLSMVNNIFTNKSSERGFTNFYSKLTRNNKSLHQQLHDKKSQILYTHMSGELDNLYQLLMETNLVQREDYAQMRTEDIKTAIAELLIQCPVYRYYGNALPLNEDEVKNLQDIFKRIRKSRNDLSGAIGLLESILIKKPLEGNEAYNQNALRFYQRCMQFTGPLMAKGVEDTLMYTYNRFISHNEVGDSPEVFGTTVEEFHEQMLDRQQQWPLSINATSTHDTKRGEGVRARLNVLTDLSEEWFALVKEWRELNVSLKKSGMPDANDEYFIYQTLLGAYPMPGQDDDNIKNRLEEYIEKALREEKVNSNWSEPNVEYEEAAKNFAVGLLDTAHPFWQSFHAFQRRIADFGMANSLAQVLLKFTCPGVADVYQGTELWDLSLVDPDNRRDVDYERREQYLNDITHDDENVERLISELWKNRYDARIKQWLVYTLFNERKHNEDVFIGDYIPLKIEGEYKGNVLAFARQHHKVLYVVAVPLGYAKLAAEQGKEILQVDWKDTRVILNGDFNEWQNVLLKTKGKLQKGIAVGEIFIKIPVALLKLEGTQMMYKKMDETVVDNRQTGNMQVEIQETSQAEAEYKRGAGILMHITSLPSPFGIGDLGPEARLFADFLHRSHQRFWQLLPINPTEQGQGHSPYSAVSGMAGNTLLISPELLVNDDLLNKDELQHYYVKNNGQTDYEQAQTVKSALFDKAWRRYKQGNFNVLQQQFTEFCNKEAGWLNDFALYMLLKKEQGGKAWFQWPKEYKLRNQQAFEKLQHQHAEELEKLKWLQFVFAKQWREFRNYCNRLDIKLIGDLPFYVSYDSVDVWSNQDIFCLDKEGNMTGMAGVPPDSFSEDGQLWGMPIYRWDVLQRHNFAWWVERLRKNVDLFDLTRLDHFRAFSAYWNVPAGEKTAKNGEWKPCPGTELFKTVEKELGSLPFIAEDLGDIDEPVYQLRDMFRMPGMVVLQFAFGHNMPESIYIPHNHTQNSIAYTGTHDNNTVRGWYRQEIDKQTQHRLHQYLGKNLREEEVHIAMGRLVYSSVAKTAILPIQDVIGMDESARMNTPASTSNNWGWRLRPNQVNVEAENVLKEWTWVYNRR